MTAIASPSTPAAKRWRPSILLLLFLFLLVGAGVWINNLQRRLTVRTDQLTALQREIDIQDLIRDLSPPDEVILSDVLTRSRVTETRKQNWAREGIKSFIPYNHILASDDPAHWAQADIAYAYSSYEREILDHLFHRCVSLADDFENNYRLGKYFNEHRSEFHRQIRPRLIRLLQTRDPWIVRDAAHALLAAGDRSPEVRTAMMNLLASSPEGAKTDPEFMDMPRDIPELARKYGIDLSVASTSPTTAPTNK